MIQGKAGRFHGSGRRQSEDRVALTMKELRANHEFTTAQAAKFNLVRCCHSCRTRILRVVRSGQYALPPKGWHEYGQNGTRYRLLQSHDQRGQQSSLVKCVILAAPGCHPRIDTNTIRTVGAIHAFYNSVGSTEKNLVE